MLASGNGKAAKCVRNLLLITRGTVPYARMKGMDATLIDKPSTIVAPLLEAEAEWLVENYEPRAALDSVDLTAELAETGHFGLSINTQNTE